MATVQELNRELADRLCEKAKLDPHAYPLGRLVGIANGQVVVIDDDLTEVSRRLDQVEPDPAKTFIVEPGRDYNEVHEIWEAR